MHIDCCCPSCEYEFSLPAKYAGSKGKCPECSALLDVPSRFGNDPGRVRDDPGCVRNDDEQFGNDDEPEVFPTVNSDSQPSAAASPPPFPRPATGPPASSVATGKPNTVAAAGPPAAPATRPTAAADSFGGMKTVPPARPPVTFDLPRTDTGSRRRARRPNRAMLVIAGGAALVLLVACGAMALLFFAGGGVDADDASDLDDNRHVANAKPVLVLNWPGGERKNATLHIDRHRVRLPESGPLRYPLAAGKHNVVIFRNGYQDVEHSVELRPGEIHEYSPKWKTDAGGLSLSSKSGGGRLLDERALDERRPGAVREAVDFHLPGYKGWLQDVNRAMRQAKTDGKDILIAFVGTDWSRGSSSLREDVFLAPEFSRAADARYVLVVIDMPRGDEAYNLLADPLHNEWACRRYGVDPQALPAVLVTETQVMPYEFLQGYAEDRKRVYLARLRNLPAERQQRDRLLARATDASGAEKSAAAAEVADWLLQRNVAHCYAAQIDDWLTAVKRFDPKNELGQFEVVFQAHCQALLLEAIAGESADDTLAAAAKVGQEVANWHRERRFRNPDCAARVFLLGAMVDRDRAPEFLDAALDYKPESAELLDRLRALKAALKAEPEKDVDDEAK